MDVNTTKFLPVPLAAVLNAVSKNDVKAIYRRPQRTVGPFDEEIQVLGPDGFPLWDLTTPLPVKRHQDWLRKGYEYVTLADMKSLEDVAPYLKVMGLNARDYIQHPIFGPWNPKLYAATAAEGDRQSYEELLDALDKFGLEAVEEIRKQKLPDALLVAWKRRSDARAGKSPTVTASTATVDSNAPAGPGEASGSENLIDRAVVSARRVVRKKKGPKAPAVE